MRKTHAIIYSILCAFSNLFTTQSNAAYSSYTIAKGTGLCSSCAGVCSTGMCSTGMTQSLKNKGFHAESSSTAYWRDNGDGTCTCRFYCEATECGSGSTDLSTITGSNCNQSCICMTGYYYSKSGVIASCLSCPEPGTYVSGTKFTGTASSIAECAISSYSLWQDSIGTFQFTNTCKYGSVS